MKETGIIMSGDHPRKILDGTKTMTRRVIKRDIVTKNAIASIIRGGELGFTKCPYGQVGDRLWVRETWCQDTDFGHGITKHMVYKASAHPQAGFIWKPSIHMFKWMSRITLEITEVRVERVQEITAGNAIQEGIATKGMSRDWVQDEGHIQGRNFSGLPSQGYAEKWYINQFRALWDSLNAKRGYGWEVNPWVWVIGFKLLKGD